MNFIDLFSGAGFGASGAVAGGGNPVLAIDNSRIAAATYQDNFPQAEVICANINDISPARWVHSNPDNIEIMLASPECTSHSVARGNIPADLASQDTAMSIFPWIDATAPNWLVIENVREMKNWHKYEEFSKQIIDRGYYINDLHLNAASFGVPQTRKRMFLICNKQNVPVTAADLARTMPCQPKTIGDILDKAPESRGSLLYKPGRSTTTIDKAQRAMRELGIGVGFVVVFMKYGRGWQPLDEPIRTIMTSRHYALVTFHNHVPYLRMLTTSELKVAMGSPAHRLNFGTNSDKWRLCGNGVCSPIIEAIFKHIRRLSNGSAATIGQTNLPLKYETGE